MQAPDSVPVCKMFHCSCLNHFGFLYCWISLSAGTFCLKEGATARPASQLSGVLFWRRASRPARWHCVAARNAFAFFASFIPPPAQVSVLILFRPAHSCPHAGSTCGVDPGRCALGTDGTLCTTPRPCHTLATSGPSHSSGYQLCASWFQKTCRLGWGGLHSFCVFVISEVGELGVFATFLFLPEPRNLFIIYFFF